MKSGRVELSGGGKGKGRDPESREEEGDSESLLAALGGACVMFVQVKRGC